MGGRGGSFNNVAESAAYRNALNVAENGIKHDRVETAILLDKHGKVLFTESQGNASSVQFTADQCAKMKDGILTHNHPSGSTFSGDDIALLTYRELKEIRATSSSRTYRLERMNGNYPDRMNFAQDFSNAYQANKVVCDAKYQKIENNYNSGAISYEELICLKQKTADIYYMNRMQRPARMLRRQKKRKRSPERVKSPER